MSKPELPKKWKPTHLMGHHDGREVKVMLVPSGAAFTRGDWAVRKSTRSTSSYKFTGQWFYWNAPFKGTVVPL